MFSSYISRGTKQYAKLRLLILKHLCRIFFKELNKYEIIICIAHLSQAVANLIPSGMMHVNSNLAKRTMIPTCSILLRVTELYASSCWWRIVLAAKGLQNEKIPLPELFHFCQQYIICPHILGKTLHQPPNHINSLLSCAGVLEMRTIRQNSLRLLCGCHFTSRVLQVSLHRTVSIAVR